MKSAEQAYSPGQSGQVALFSAIVETTGERGVFCTGGRWVIGGARVVSWTEVNVATTFSRAAAGTLAMGDILLPHMTPDRQYPSPPAAHPTWSWEGRPLPARVGELGIQTKWSLS